MEVHNVQVTNVGNGIKFNPSPHADVSYDSSEEVPFNDRAVLDFGNLTVSTILLHCMMKTGFTAN